MSYGRPMTAQDCAEQANRAIKAGRLNEAEALLERAKAIKAGPAALAAFERQAEASIFAPEAARALRQERIADVRLDRAMGEAFKAEALAEIDPDAEKLANELHGGNYAEAAYNKQRAYARYLKGVDVQHLGGADRTVVLSPRQLLEAVREGWSAAQVKATMVESQDAGGGFLVAEAVREEVLGRATTLTVVRARATVDTPGASGSLAFPVWQGSGDVYSTALRGVWGSETQAGSAETPTLGKVTPDIKLWRLKIPVSRSLFEDSGARLVRNLNMRIAEAASVAEDREELVGEGVTAPLGILAQQTPGVLANKDVRVTNSGAPADITADGVINMVYSLPMQYRAAPGFCVTCNAATLKRVRLLKDQSGRYLFEDRDHTLLGYPLVESESMADIAANAHPLLCGDFAGYYLADRLGLAIQLYKDSSVADLDQVILYVRRRVGGVPGEGYRFASLKVAA